MAFVGGEAEMRPADERDLPWMLEANTRAGSVLDGDLDVNQDGCGTTQVQTMDVGGGWLEGDDIEEW